MKRTRQVKTVSKLRALRITFVLGHQLPFPPTAGGGVNQLVWSLAREFSRLGHQVSVCSPLVDRLAPIEVDEFGIHHLRFYGAPLRRGRWLDNLSGLPYAYRVWRGLPGADVTSFHAPFSFLLRFRKGLGLCTHTIHRSPKWILRLYGGMDRIYAGSHATVKEALAIAPQLADRLKAIHNCIDCNEQATQDAPDVSVPCALIYVGRFVPDKGLEFLIGGAIDAIKFGCRISLTTIGPQTDENGGDFVFFNAMKSLIERERMSDYFNFCPSINVRSHLLACVAKHEVFCLPSTSGETFSMAALEAMASGKPLLTSDYGPMVEMVADGVNGFTVRSGDRKAWAEAIQRVCRQRKDLVKMGQQSFEMVKQKFSVKIIANEYLADFKALMGVQG